MKNKILSKSVGLYALSLLFCCGAIRVADARPISEREPPGTYSEGYAAGYSDGYAAGYRAGRFGNKAPESEPLPSDAHEPVAGVAECGRVIHSVGAEFRPEYIFPTNPFLKGENASGRPLSVALSAHLRYAFRHASGSAVDRIIPGGYQGLGFARYFFGDSRELGDPLAVYLFQGARLARLLPRLSLNYEWNFGISWGWKPYDYYDNPANIMMGSKLNAYLNVDCYLQWLLTQRLSLTAGLTLSHFSNGNTQIPNAGLNTGGAKFGIAYRFGPADGFFPTRIPRALRPEFPRHVSYDLVLFGSWCRKGVDYGGRVIVSPEAYTVVGFNFSAMYNFGYKFRAGISADGVYDRSANLYTKDYIVSVGGDDPGYKLYSPDFSKQIALGLSARGEFVMPYFTVGVGIGYNVLQAGGDLKALYEVVTLKIAATRNAFVHVGYCLRNFRDPNYLMLGVGYRFNNKYPRLR